MLRGPLLIKQTIMAAEDGSFVPEIKSMCYCQSGHRHSYTEQLLYFVLYEIPYNPNQISFIVGMIHQQNLIGYQS